MGYSIGISAYFHESSVSLFQDGELIEFSREEYFSRIKGDNNFPRLTIRYLIEKYDILEKEIDYVAFYEKPLLSFLNVTLYALQHFPDSRKLIYNNLMKIRQSGLFFSSDVKKHLKIPNNKIIYCPHHLSHVLSTFPFLPDQETHVSVVIDGVGDTSSTSIYKVDKGNIKFLDSVEYPFSLGLIYSSVTDYLGFNINDGEYKVMALASYGTGILNKKFQSLVSKKDSTINLKNFSYYKSIEKSYTDDFIKVFGKPFDKLTSSLTVGSSEFIRATEIAHSTQEYLEENVVNIFDKIHETTGCSNFSLSGGVALNSKLVTKIAQKEYIDAIFVPPNPGDSGAAIGAGVFGSLKSGFKIQNNSSPYQGPTPDRKGQVDVKSEFLTFICEGEDAYSKTAKLIDQGEILGLINGRMEVGPRALGHRSLVCDPRNKIAVDKLSQKIKNRETFRPLAPACLETFTDDWFIVSDKIRQSLHWMGALVQPTKKCLNEIPSVCHVDQTARMQIVRENHEPFHHLLTQFFRLSGIPILINTSFNCGGDPIVCDVQDAITSSIRMNINYLLVESKLFKVK